MIHLQGIYVDYIFQGSNYEKRIERIKLENEQIQCPSSNIPKDEIKRFRIVRRAAEEFKNGMYGKC